MIGVDGGDVVTTAKPDLLRPLGGGNRATYRRPLGPTRTGPTMRPEMTGS